MSRKAALRRRVRSLKTVPHTVASWSFLPSKVPGWPRPEHTPHAPDKAELDADVAAAWIELRTHPALSWVPPMWRTVDPTTEPNRHAISALDRNLNVDILLVGTHSLEVRLATGPLKDRRVGDGLDPLTPVASTAPELTVSASSFEQAVLELRDAVVKNYGPADFYSLSGESTAAEQRSTAVEPKVQRSGFSSPQLRSAH